MKFTGRITAISLILFFHTLYIIYYIYRDGYADILDWLGYPVFFIISYWAGLQYDKAKFYSEKDELTNIYNRRFVVNTFDKITSLADRTNSKLFVLMIDCDNFKNINDVYDHQTGDLILNCIGKILVENTRKSDIVARWGGDEFLVIGQYKDEPGLQIVLQRLESDLLSLAQKMQISVSVSIGFAIYWDDHRQLPELIKIADQRMYDDKTQKKDDAAKFTVTL
ncbi:GGDEF domain-containing protein [Cohnella sp.]|uniref:GGDEF domain-containing protein n=1 Tax=Cohnella sp. TaxID=1883426 RepID=UPI00356A6885